MSAARSQGERRRKSRKRPLTLVYVELTAGNGGMMRDLSAEGFAVRAMIPVRAGDKTPFTFFLSDSTKVEGEGMISWVEENGHVAGVRFTEISDAARAQIQDWLVRPEKPPSREASTEKQQAARETTLEQLREEMYSVPPRPAGTLPMEAPVTAVATQQSSVPVEPETASGPVEAHTAPEGKSAPEAAHETPPLAPPHPAELHPDNGDAAESTAPPLPHLKLPPAEVRPESHGARSAHEVSVAQKRWKPIDSDDAESEESEPTEAEHTLPDISAILMQPHGKAQRAAQHVSPHASAVETLASWDPDQASHESSSNRLSLSGAVKVMAVIALAVAVYVFHQNVGQGLIWLGEALGGVRETATQQAPAAATQTPQTEAPAAQNQTSDQPAQSQTATASNTGATDATGALPVLQDPTPGPPASLSGNTTGASQAPAANNPATSPEASRSPVSPLSGISAPAPSANFEGGQSEYLQAMQVLHSGNARAATPEALRLLWIAVEKGNANAELELADMYWRGRGVLQNCDQALILLTAAARKGSGEAQKRLLQYRKQGCG